MPRLFTALDLPPSTVDALRTFRQEQNLDVRARWTPPRNLHITLRFVGEIDDKQADRVEATLSDARHHTPFDVQPLGLGVLPSRPNPHVLTVRIDPTEPLQDLYHAVQDALATVDIEREERTFRPHITLARMKNVSPERLYESLRETSGPSLGAFSVDRFYLYESTLTPDGAVHAIRAEYPFDGD